MKHSLSILLALAASVAGCGRPVHLSDAGADLPDSVPVPDVFKELPWVSSYAGTSCLFSVDGDLSSAVLYPGMLAVSPSGTVYFAEFGHQMRAVIGNRVTTIVSDGSKDDGPVAASGFDSIRGLVVGPDESIYVAEPFRVRRIAGGFVTTLAGSREEHFRRDGVGADARFLNIQGITLSTDAVIVADASALRRLDADGTVTTIAGTDEESCPVDGPALQASVVGVSAVATTPSAVVFSDFMTIRSLEDGEVKTIAGKFEMPFVPRFQDGPAADARFADGIPSIATFGEEVFIADKGNFRIRRLASGWVSSVTNGERGLRDGKLEQALFSFPNYIAFLSPKKLLVSDLGNCRIRLIELE